MEKALEKEKEKEKALEKGKEEGQTEDGVVFVGPEGVVEKVSLAPDAVVFRVKVVEPLGMKPPFGGGGGAVVHRGSSVDTSVEGGHVASGLGQEVLGLNRRDRDQGKDKRDAERLSRRCHLCRSLSFVVVLWRETDRKQHSRKEKAEGLQSFAVLWA